LMHCSNVVGKSHCIIYVHIYILLIMLFVRAAGIT